MVANADREELTMTALGAGSALSTLQSFGRAVIALHGHKHYPTARVVVGTSAAENDVAILSAGSAGVAEAWSPAGGRDTGHLWPSFNVLDIEDRGARVTVTTVAFSTDHVGELAPVRRLVSLERRGSKWTAAPVAQIPTVEPALASNEARFTLTESKTFPDRWDLACTRTLRLCTEAREEIEYREVVEAAPRAEPTALSDPKDSPLPKEAPFKLNLSTRHESTYSVLGCVCRNVAGAARAYKDGTTFEWVAVVNRLPSEEASLEVSGLPLEASVFGSVTDLTTGRETPWEAKRSDSGTIRLACAPCPARWMLRVHWLLE
jgi:hypothetical protein